MFIRLCLLFLAFPLGATVFRPQSVDQQITDADGIIVGHYLKSRAIKLEDGKIATQMIFKMNQEVGMQSDLFRMEEIIVHYPGGKIGDEHMRVEGVPSFVSGEKVIIMIKSNHDRYWGMNLGFGTFKVINYGKDKMIVNTLFPHDKSVGQMRLEEFERSVKRIKGSNLKVVLSADYPTEELSDASGRLPASVEEEGKNRAIASNSDQGENEVAQPFFNNFWLVLLLAVLGGLFRLTRPKEAK